MAKRRSSRVLLQVRRHWPNADIGEIAALLKECGSGERVQLAIIKLSHGDRDRLPDLVRQAKSDFRDVVAVAEYPEEMRVGWAAFKQLSPREKRALKKRDKRQYARWLRRKSSPSQR